MIINHIKIAKYYW